MEEVKTRKCKRGLSSSYEVEGQSRARLLATSMQLLHAMRDAEVREGHAETHERGWRARRRYSTGHAACIVLAETGNRRRTTSLQETGDELQHGSR